MLTDRELEAVEALVANMRQVHGAHYVVPPGLEELCVLPANLRVHSICPVTGVASFYLKSSSNSEHNHNVD